MDLIGVGNTRTYIKSLNMRTQWRQKQAAGAYTGQTKGTRAHRTEQEAEYSATISQLERMRESGAADTTLQSAYNKLYSGKKLTASEKDSLKEKAPEAYAQAVSMEQKRKSFERALKRCRTQEDVQRLKLSHLNVSMSFVESIAHNPHISKAKKLESILMEQGKLAAMDRTLQDFVHRGCYDGLPTEEELRQVEEAVETLPHPEDGGARKPVSQQERPQPPSAASLSNQVPSQEEAQRTLRKGKRGAAYAQAGEDAAWVFPVSPQPIQGSTPSIDLKA